MKNGLKRLVVAAILATITCMATVFIKIPLPYGYINLGDCFVLLSGWILGPAYGFVSSAVGSAMADVIGGYALYAPITFVIKGLMAIVCFGAFKFIRNKTAGRIFGAIVAEILMVAGYYVFEGFIYGFTVSLASIPFNLIQGLIGAAVALLGVKYVEKLNI